MALLRGSLPEERPTGPLHGYKLGYPMLSADRRTGAFGGIWLSGQAVYRLDDTAVCFWNHRHVPPKRRCSCGFYCVHSLETAEAMACEEGYRSTVLLEVEVKGRFIRYESGFRYSNQRVVGLRTTRCRCGRPVDHLTDSGSGIRGWVRLDPSCRLCVAGREALPLAAFAALVGDRSLFAGAGALSTASDGGTGVTEYNLSDQPADDLRSAVGVLTAEIALLQARVDSLQAEVARLNG